MMGEDNGQPVDLGTKAVQVCSYCRLGLKYLNERQQVVCPLCYDIGHGELYVGWEAIPLILKTYGIEVSVDVIRDSLGGAD